MVVRTSDAPMEERRLNSIGSSQSKDRGGLDLMIKEIHAPSKLKA